MSPEPSASSAQRDKQAISSPEDEMRVWLEDLTARLLVERERLGRLERDLADLKRAQEAHATTPPGLAADIGTEIALVESLLAAQRDLVGSQEQQRTQLRMRLSA